MGRTGSILILIMLLAGAIASGSAAFGTALIVCAALVVGADVGAVDNVFDCIQVSGRAVIDQLNVVTVEIGAVVVVDRINLAGVVEVYGSGSVVTIVVIPIVIVMYSSYKTPL